MQRTNRLFFLIPTTIAVLACKVLIPEQSPAAVQPVTVVISTEAVETVIPAKEINTEKAPSVPGYVIVDLNPSDGGLPEQTRFHAAEASKAGLTLVVEFGAQW